MLRNVDTVLFDLPVLIDVGCAFQYFKSEIYMKNVNMWIYEYSPSPSEIQIISYYSNNTLSVFSVASTSCLPFYYHIDEVVVVVTKLNQSLKKT